MKPPFDLRIDSPKLEHRLGDGVLRVYAQFGCRAIDHSETEFLRVECRYLVEYGLNAYTPTEEEVEAFVPGNPVFNCWPYFREFVQSTSLRMSFAGVPPIPLLRVLVKPRDSQIEPTPPSAPSSREPAKKRGPANKRVPRSPRNRTDQSKSRANH